MITVYVERKAIIGCLFDLGYVLSFESLQFLRIESLYYNINSTLSDTFFAKLARYHT